MVDMFLDAGIARIDNVFMRTRRLVNAFERPVGTSSGHNAVWHGYSPYNPRMVEKYLTIFRTVSNWLFVGDDGATPAMRTHSTQSGPAPFPAQRQAPSGAPSAEFLTPIGGHSQVLIDMCARTTLTSLPQPAEIDCSTRAPGALAPTVSKGGPILWEGCARSLMTDNDQAMRNLVATLPVPEFAEAAFTAPPPLRNARVAIVTSAALYREGAAPFGFEDVHFEPIPHSARDLKMGHVSPNFDRAGFAADLNVVYPVDRLSELAERGTIGSVADFHYAFAGNQPDTVSELRLDTGPGCARKLLEDGVDVVLLTPV